MNYGLQKTFLEKVKLPKDTHDFVNDTEQFQQIMMMYNCAIREVKTKLEVLNDELSIRNNRNPIEFIKSRIKKPQSIVDKLNRKNLEVSINSIIDNLNDVAGVRVVCSFIDDIYEVARMLTRQDDIKLIEVKDYIKNPKENGYRSLHLIVEIPVFFSDITLPLRVEVQIRTIAMDFWASLEHKLKYKHNIEEAEFIGAELKECSDIISKTDFKMQEIRDRIHKSNL